MYFYINLLIYIENNLNSTIRLTILYYLNKKSNLFIKKIERVYDNLF